MLFTNLDEFVKFGLLVALQGLLLLNLTIIEMRKMLSELWTGRLFSINNFRFSLNLVEFVV